MCENATKYPNIHIIDHSVANIVDITAMIPSCSSRLHHIPYQINPHEILSNILDISKTKEVIMSCITTTRRKDASMPIINKLNEFLKNKNCSVDFITG